MPTEHKHCPCLQPTYHINYTYHSQKLDNGNTIEYKIYNGTYYHADTPDAVVHELEMARERKTRIKLDYGDTKTGKSWGERYDIVGTVGRSTGTIKIPLLIYSKRSHGGGGILDNCIIKIEHANKKQGGILYELNA